MSFSGWAFPPPPSTPSRSPHRSPVPSPSPNPKWTVTPTMRESYAGLVSGLANLLTTGEFSDLKILCGDSEFKVHKSVICCQSKPLMAMCTNGMKESQESVIDLTVDTEPCVSRLVKFLYSCDYDALADDNDDASMDHSDTNNDNVDSENGTDDHGTLREARVPSKNAVVNSGIYTYQKTWISMTSRQLSMHVDMYVLADKYDIVSLSNLAKKRFKQVAEDVGVYPEGTKYKFPVLDTIPRIYAVTGEHNRGLRDAVVEYARLQRPKFDVNDAWMNNTHGKIQFMIQIDSLFKTVPEFAVDVSRSWLETPYLGCEL